MATRLQLALKKKLCQKLLRILFEIGSETHSETNIKENKMSDSIKENEPFDKKTTWNSSTKTIQKIQKLGQLEYTTICGEITVDSPTGESDKRDTGKVFYTAYLTDNIRPLIFFFNGGPGGSSVWLHLGAFGPKFVAGLDVNHSLSQLIDNPDSLLTCADLVFVDPIGTGFSRHKEGSLPDFCSETADAASLSQFISRFLGQHKLWGRPLYLCGESYGGYRVALMSHLLICKYDLAPKGLILVAPFLSGTSGEESEPNLIAEANYLCGYILSAWYHKKSILNKSCVDEVSAYKEAKKFAYKEYLPERLENSPHTIASDIIKKLEAFSGISATVFKKHGIKTSTFCENLFYGEKKFPGRIDARYTLEHPFSSTPFYVDASLMALAHKISPLINAYLFNEIGWESSQSYISFNGELGSLWRFHEPFYSSGFSALRASLKLNPEMKVYAAGGYFDLAVPMASVEYDLMQVADTENLKNRIYIEAFTSGHMMYVKDDCRNQLTTSIKRYFFNQ